ncbi:ATP synthase subunit I [Comamonadaceae bacterium PP-2]
MKREPDDREIDREEDEEFKPLTPEAAQQLAGRMPKLAPWRLLGWQLASGLVLAAAAWMLSGLSAVWSVLYGVVAVMLPAVLFIRGMLRLQGAQGKDAGMALIVFMVCEFGKIALTVVLLVLAPRILGAHMSWLGLLLSVVVTLKMYWVALWVQFRSYNRTIRTTGKS